MVSGLLQLAARASARGRLVVLLALLIGVGATLAGSSVLPLMSREAGDPDAESSRALSTVTAVTGTSAGRDDLVLLVDLPAAWPAAAAVDDVAAVAGRVQDTAGVVGVVAPTPDGGDAAAALLADGGRVALVTAAVDADADRADVARTVRDDFAGDRAVAVGGSAVVDLEFGERVESDLGRAELFAFPVLFLLALWIFRGAVAALVPVLVGGLSVVGTLAVLRALVEVTSVSQYVVNLVIGLGLGLAVDYSLLLVSRYREEVLVDGYGRAAAVRTVRSAGRTVLFSASTVAMALATLLIFPQEFLYSMGIGGVVVTVVAALAAVLVVPALLVVLGPRLDAWSLPRWRRAQQQESADVEAGWWYFIARMAMKHARRVLPLTLVLAALLAAPALFTRFGSVDVTALPTDSAARQVSERVADTFGTGGTTLLLAVTATPGQGEQVDDLLTRAVDAAGAGAQAVAPAASVGADLWTAQVRVPSGPFDDRAQDAVAAVRALSSPVPFLVGGDAAGYVDLADSIGAHLPFALGISALAILAVMFLLTGSVVLAVKTLLLNALNVAMTFGVLVFVFQYGHLEWLLRFDSTGRIDLTQPILVAIIAFGLSTDYGVFLFSRIVEAHEEGLDDVDAVAIGIGRSGRIISSAALLLCVAIGAFSSSSILFIKQLGVGAAVAVFLDATLVRALLVPSAMKLMGAVNWWSPAFLRRFHDRFGVRESGGIARPEPVVAAEIAAYLDELGLAETGPRPASRLLADNRPGDAARRLAAAREAAADLQVRSVATSPRPRHRSDDDVAPRERARV